MALKCVFVLLDVDIKNAFKLTLETDYSNILLENVRFFYLNTNIICYPDSFLFSNKASKTYLSPTY